MRHQDADRLSLIRVTTAQFHSKGCPPDQAKSRYRERPEIDVGILAGDKIGHDPARDGARCQTDMSVTERVDDVRRGRGYANDGTAVRRRWPMPHPAIDRQARTWSKSRVRRKGMPNKKTEAGPSGSWVNVPGPDRPG